MWLPYWFASRSEHCQVCMHGLTAVFGKFLSMFDLNFGIIYQLQELASVKWRLHGKPAVDALMQKVCFVRILCSPYLLLLVLVFKSATVSLYLCQMGR